VKRRLPIEERALAAASQVALGAGRTPLATRPTPSPVPSTLRTNEVIPIANAGTMAVGRSTPWDVLRGGSSLVTVIRARTSASGSSTFRWRLNGTLTGDTITLPSGDNYVANIQAFATVPGDELDLECLTVGTGLADVGGRAEING